MINYFINGNLRPFPIALSFVFCILYFVLLSCDEGTSTDSDPPSAPVMVEKDSVSDMLAHEIMGIDAVAGPENKIRIIWKAHPERTTLDHFNVYRTEDPQGLINFSRVAQVESGGEFLYDSIYHSFTDINDLEEENPYNYYVTAVNEDGKESLPSDTVWYQLIQKASLTEPLGTNVTNPEVLSFKWVFTSNPLPHVYILRIEDDFTDELVYIEWVEPIPNYNQIYRTHILTSDQLKNFVVNSRPYRWRIDAWEKDPINYGSESNWGSFTINWGK